MRAAAQKFQGMSLQEDSAATGAEVPPQLTSGETSEAVHLPDVEDSQEAIPEDFWKPVDTNPRAPLLAGRHQLTLHVVAAIHCSVSTATLAYEEHPR